MKEITKIDYLNVENLIDQKDYIISMMMESWEISFPNDFDKEVKVRARYKSLVEYIMLKKAKVLAAIRDDKIIGILWYFTKNGFIYHVNQLVVSEKARRLGVGSKLMNMLTEEAKKEGIDEIELFVSKANMGAKKFYDNHGFEVERIFNHGFEVERILMRRNIDD
ncbi:GNAT family N-acetyltransferase [Aerococcus viridans]|uniref:N-acetyltransferase domain-containing protein n=1 Tax=Aerococcus viridans TaxID=1377 RepID=A0A2J9PNN8_9LACT|nr:GNAT family N-acetyltransferase [Aerococcus viridans]PNL91955.1 hypothetical protein A6J77_006830 [Aerococcus viridans]